MSQCVPSWELEDPTNPTHRLPPHRKSPVVPLVTVPDDEVAELTWENGHLYFHGLGTPRFNKVIPKHPPSPPPVTVTAAAATWRKHFNSSGGGGGTLEAVVDQATRARGIAAEGGAHLDAVVPSVTRRPADAVAAKEQRSSTLVRLGTYGGVGDDVDMTSTTYNSDGSPQTGNTCGHTRSYQRDTVCEVEEKEKEARKGDVKRTRIAAVHNQSERKRRDRINQRIKALQNLVPNSSKTDKASMLDEVIEYVKQLQFQAQMMTRMSTMMMPMAMQQLQQSMMAQMAQMTMGMGMNMMDLNSTLLSNLFHPLSVLPFTTAAAAAAAVTSNDSADRLLQPSAATAAVVPEPSPAFLASPSSQAISMDDAYSRMLALFQQQLYQQKPPVNPN